jgi:hypothetical protein
MRCPTRWGIHKGSLNLKNGIRNLSRQATRSN